MLVFRALPAGVTVDTSNSQLFASEIISQHVQCAEGGVGFGVVHRFVCHVTIFSTRYEKITANSKLCLDEYDALV
jgi:hypothetical protein